MGAFIDHPFSSLIHSILHNSEAKCISSSWDVNTYISLFLCVSLWEHEQCNIPIFNLIHSNLRNCAHPWRCIRSCHNTVWWWREGLQHAIKLHVIWFTAARSPASRRRQHHHLDRKNRKTAQQEEKKYQGQAKKNPHQTILVNWFPQIWASDQ